MPARKSFEIEAQWDDEAGVWWCSNDALPLTAEAPTFEALAQRVLEIAPEIMAENALAAPGEEIELHLFAERVGWSSVESAEGSHKISVAAILGLSLSVSLTAERVKHRSSPRRSTRSQIAEVARDAAAPGSSRQRNVSRSGGRECERGAGPDHLDTALPWESRKC